MKITVAEKLKCEWAFDCRLTNNTVLLRSVQHNIVQAVFLSPTYWAFMLLLTYVLISKRGTKWGLKELTCWWTSSPDNAKKKEEKPQVWQAVLDHENTTPQTTVAFAEIGKSRNQKQDFFPWTPIPRRKISAVDTPLETNNSAFSIRLQCRQCCAVRWMAAKKPVRGVTWELNFDICFHVLNKNHFD